MDYREQTGKSNSQSFQGYLVQEFGTSSQVYEEVVPYVFNRVVESDNNSRIFKHFQFWREAVDFNLEKIKSDIKSSLSDLDINHNGDNRAEEFLYSLQSYYTLILNADRIASIKYLASGDTSDSIRYQDLASEFGNFLRQPEDKPFEPWLECLGTEQEPINQIIPIMTESPGRSSGEDGFKDLYQDIIGNPFRKAMGEFYTRGWLAELILEEIGYDGSSILDPACGSGAFLVKAAKRVISDTGIESLSTVFGFDLNPVAVAAAKSNLLGTATTYVNEGTLTAGELKKIHLSIHWTNSIIWKEPDLHGNNVTLLSPLNELHFPENSEVAKNKVRSDIMSWADSQPFSDIFENIWFDNIADSFTAPVQYSPFDFVIGNPPWVSPDRMSEDYRDRVKELLDESGFLEPFQPDYLTNRFPNKQFVAALPFYEVSMRHYVDDDDGKCAYLVTSSLLKSMNGGGFREQMQKWNMTQMLDFTPYTDIHQRANSWGCVPVISRAAGDEPSIEYEYFTPTDGTMPPHKGNCRDLKTPDNNFHVCSWEIPRRELPFISDDAKSPWFTAPPGIVQIYRQMLEGNPYVGENYRFTRGLVTGRNSVYIINEIEGGKEESQVKTSASEGEIRVESSRIYPFVEGKSLTSWDFDYRYLLLPYDVPDWTPLSETKLKSNYPKTHSYFESNKEELKNRRTHTISSQIESGNPYYVIESRDILGERAVVGVREIAPYLEAAVIPSSTNDDILGDRETVVAHTLNFVVPESDEEAYYLAGVFNSWAVRTLLYDLAQPKGGRPGKRFDMYLISSIPIPKFDSSNPTHQEVANLAERAHSIEDDEEKLDQVEEQLNNLVAQEIYSITKDELNSLKEHYKRLSHTAD